jgi:type IV pilus assembly protein PilF
MRLNCLIVIAFVICCPTAAAKKFVQHAIPTHEAQLQLGYAERAMQMNDLDAAFTHAKSAVVMDPKAAETHIMLGVISARRGDNAQAAQSFKRATKINKQHFSAWFHQAEWQCANREMASAFKSYRQSFDASYRASPMGAYVSAINCAIQLNQLSVADEFAQQGLKRFSQSPALLLAMAHLQYQHQDYFRARAFVQRAEALVSLDARALQLAANIEEKIGDGAASKRYLSRLAQLQPEQSE